MTLQEHAPKYIQVAMKLMYGNLIGSHATQSKVIVKLLQHMSAKQGKAMDQPSSVKKIPVRPMRVHPVKASSLSGFGLSPRVVIEWLAC